MYTCPEISPRAAPQTLGASTSGFLGALSIAFLTTRQPYRCYGSGAAAHAPPAGRSKERKKLARLRRSIGHSTPRGGPIHKVTRLWRRDTRLWQVVHIHRSPNFAGATEPLKHLLLPDPPPRGHQAVAVAHQAVAVAHQAVAQGGGRARV